MTEHGLLPPGVPALINGRYEIQSLIGRGGMADVYLGIDHVLARKVAVKLLRSDTARDSMVVSRFAREAKAVAGLSHPNIVAVYDSGVIPASESRHENLPFIVMEYVTGRTLRQVLKDEYVEPQYAVDVMNGVCQALEHSHSKNVVHRDIKPANVMVTDDGHVKLMDFGIARAVNDSSATMTQTAAVVGTAQYLSPEQARGEVVDHRTDIYSAGCLLYELLVHSPPFTGDSMVSVAYQHVGEDPTPPSEANENVPQIYDAVVLKALAKDRGARFSSAAELSHALDDAFDGIAYADPSTKLNDATLPIYQSAGVGSYHHAQEGSSALEAPSTSEHPVFSSRQELREGTPPKVRSHRGLMWLISIIAIIAVGFAGYMVYRTIQIDRERNAPVSIPVVAEMTESEATQLLQGLDLNVQVEHEFSDSVDEDLVTRTDPVTGTSVPKESVIRMYLSDGSEQRTIPESLVNQTEVSAREALREAGLKVGEVTRVNHPTIPTDWVVETTPELGSKVKAGTTVDLVLSTGQVTVPDLTGKNIDEAIALLEADELGLKAQYTYVEDAEADPDTVLSQNDGPNTDVAQRSTIVLTVARKPEASPSPSESSAPTSVSPEESTDTDEDG